MGSQVAEHALLHSLHIPFTVIAWVMDLGSSSIGLLMKLTSKGGVYSFLLFSVFFFSFMGDGHQSPAPYKSIPGVQ